MIHLLSLIVSRTTVERFKSSMPIFSRQKHFMWMKFCDVAFCIHKESNVEDLRVLLNAMVMFRRIHAFFIVENAESTHHRFIIYPTGCTQIIQTLGGQAKVSDGQEMIKCEIFKRTRLRRAKKKNPCVT